MFDDNKGCFDELKEDKEAAKGLGKLPAVFSFGLVTFVLGKEKGMVAWEAALGWSAWSALGTEGGGNTV